MNKTKLLTGMLLVLAVLFAQVGTVLAAPAAQDTTTITGSFVSLTTETDENGVITNVLITLDNMGKTQTVRISLATAVELGLVTVVSPTELTVDVQPGDTVNINPALVILDEEEDVHPIAAILATFFEKDAGEVNDLHEDGFGFGLIAQALWMEKNILDNELSDGSITAALILQAKKDNDYSQFMIQLPDGTSYTPTNWGQFKKVVLDKKNNLGWIVSGHADNGTENSLTQQGKGKDKNQGKGNGNNRNP